MFVHRDVLQSVVCEFDVQLQSYEEHGPYGVTQVPEDSEALQQVNAIHDELRAAGEYYYTVLDKDNGRRAREEVVGTNFRIYENFFKDKVHYQYRPLLNVGKVIKYKKRKAKQFLPGQVVRSLLFFPHVLSQSPLA